ncbi:MAG: hypothetical protein OER43_02520 [Gammaproteobacteria bacterium]|nr:hypothetical protein [Gammaproteobacteria bacterium]
MAAIVPHCVASIEPNGNNSAKLTLIARNGFFALVALALLLMSGCAAQRTVLPAWTLPQLPPPRVATLPLTVGVHYPDAFHREKHQDKMGEAFWYVHKPGGASVALFDSVLSATFERIVRIPTWPPTGGAHPEVALVIVPNISDVRTDYPGYLYRTITYEISIFTAGGVRIDNWTVVATGTGTVFTSHETFSTSALRDGAAQLLIGLRERPEIRARLPAHDPAPITEAAADARARNNGIVILTSASGGESWETCMKDALSVGTPSVPVIETERFRDAVFPWFEPSVLPESDAGAQRIKNPLVGAAAMEIGARYVLLVGGKTVHGQGKGPFWCGGGYGGAGCLGVTSAERHTSLSLTLWDLLRREAVDEIEASESGSATWIGIVVPIPIISMTETEACQEAAAKVRQLLKDR